MHITILPESQAFIEQMVNEGKYANEEEVINESLRRFEQQAAAELEELRILVAVGVEQVRRGETVELTPELRACMMRNVQERLQRRGNVE